MATRAEDELSSVQVTVTHDESSVRGGARGVHLTPHSRSKIPDDLLETVYSRLMLAALLYGGAYLIAYGAGFVTGAYTALGTDTLVSRVAAAASIVTSLLVAILAYSRRLSPHAMIDAGLAYEVVGALGIDAYLASAPLTMDVVPMGISWVGVWILTFVLVVPSTPGKALVASLASASATPLMLLVGAARGTADLSAPAVVQFVLPNYLCVLIAFASARAIHRMRQQVREARQLGSYRLVELLGRGGMGEVWRAKHHTLARPAAVKLIRPAAVGQIVGGGDAASIVFRRFEREAQATAALQSVNTITLYDFGISDDGSFYYVMELLEGLDLHRLVQKFGPVPPARTIHFLKQICHSLEEAHGKGLVHRDIKPANVYTCKLGRDFDFVKVLDFGLVKPARQGEEATQLTLTGSATGTPAYMAPEMALGRAVDARADVYSLGCVGFWLLTGSLPFEASSAVEMAVHHVQTKPPAASEKSEFEIPPALDMALLACMQKDPGHRPQTVTHFAALLELDAVQPWTGAHAESWWATNLPELASQASLPVLGSERPGGNGAAGAGAGAG